MVHNFAWKGIVEGFYGRPWTHKERLDMISFISEVGMNAYMYAPKDDPYHRENWRNPYPSRKLESLRELASHAKSHGISFVFAVSPGMSVRYSDKRDIDAFMQKLKALYGAGVRDFAILYDDIPNALSNEADREKFPNLASAQVCFANSVWERLKKWSGDNTLMVCPTQYNGDYNTEYVLGIGAGLHQDIDIMWTGPDVCSRELTYEYTQAVTAALMRPVVYWDNYPVNDAGMRGELHIGPYTGRDRRLPEVCRGFFLNPMNQAEASKIALGAAASYLRNPEGYDPQAAWEAAAVRVLGEDALEAITTFADACAISPLHPEDPPMLKEAVDRAVERATENFQEGAGILSAYMLKMKASAELLRTNPNTKFVEEARPWLEEYVRWTDIGMHIAETVEKSGAYLVSSASSGRRGFSLHALPIVSARRKLSRMMSDAVNFKTRVCGDVLLQLGRDLLRQLQ
ncbi:MAG TPA: protein O-GlcNAcase [Bacillota bacterium]|nr:protein O-GlcNAcase [Bacillota bacterium]HOO30606.1 protein O-GlcNAcase [Bacillota bacterium]HPQ02597.1 protein O-GlcNAcase [Bacillota bacterium]HPZ14276.1 protein O-GlcNAcase [Bacillota bacterium]HQD80970.1 protein O-GlcNAcase [Bacillota bacterium]